MIVGIDAVNIRAGGGLTHLFEVLSHAQPRQYGITKVIVWGGKELKKLPAREWMDFREVKAANASFMKKTLWKLFSAEKTYASGCDILWSPGGTFHSSRVPYVSMSQNMLIFEKKERNRFPISFTWMRYLILNIVQTKSFRGANGIIFLSQYAKNTIGKQITLDKIPHQIIPHGINPVFKSAPQSQKSITSYSERNPFRILYVSTINFYKHQVELVEAIKRVRKKYPIELILIGAMYKGYEKNILRAVAHHQEYIHYKGKVAYEKLNQEYKNADLFAFCSTCENMPNILVEAMSSGLPIASSSYGPMPEILGDTGVYFDPVNSADIEDKIIELIQNEDKRREIAKESYILAEKYSWDDCAKNTFEFIAGCYDRLKR